MVGPLEGVKVVEMAGVVMAPFSAQLLGDLGATVVKVEPTHGELARHFPGGRHPGMGPLFLANNKSKQAIALNIKDGADYKYFIELLKKADIFITNQRPKSLEKLNIAYEQISAELPHLIYCSAQGFRLDSDKKDDAAYDEVIQSVAGLTSAMEKLTGNPSCVPSILADKISGLAIALSALAALHNRDKTGKGQFVNIPMADVMFTFNMIEHLDAATFFPPQGDDVSPLEGKFGYPLSFGKYHGDSLAKDGYVSLHPYSLENVIAVLKACGREDILENDPYFQSWENVNADGRTHLYEVLQEVAPLLTIAEWIEVAEKNSVPAAEVVSLDNPLKNEYIRSGNTLTTINHPTEGEILVPRFPIHFSQTPISELKYAPTLDQNREEILTFLDKN